MNIDGLKYESIQGLTVNMLNSRTIVSAVLLLFLLQSLQYPLTEDYNSESSKFSSVSKLSGIDIIPTEFKFTYSDSQYTADYGLLSSADLNSGTSSVTRPNWMWIVDGMLGISQTITLTVANNGQTASGAFDVEIIVKHDEYNDFYLYTGVHPVGNIAGGNSAEIQFNWVPDYAGNHTIIATSMHAQDDNPNNDLYSRHYTIGYMYQNANALAGWTLPANNHWYHDMDSGISPTDFTSTRNSFHFGTDGVASSSQYGNGWNDDLISPTYDMSDRHPSPNSAYGIGFLFTGAVDAGDPMSIDVWDGTNWITVVSVTGIVDRDANSWQILLGNDNIAATQVPWQPIPASSLNAATKFRFNFQSDGVTTDTGYWVDDIVMFYDQVVRPEEFAVSIGANGGGSARSGEWSDQLVTLNNDGELTDYIIPEIKNLPADWEWRLKQESGTNIDLQNGMEIARKSSKNIRVQLKPGPNATVSTHNYTLDISSSSNPLKIDSKVIPMNVLPSFEPELITPTLPPSCPPGSYCEFQIGLLNAGDDDDTFSIEANIFYLRNGWTLGLSPEQATTIFVEEGHTEQIKFAVNVPQDALPGQYSSIDLLVTSQTNPAAYDMMNINATASMVSNAEIGIDYSSIEVGHVWIVDPGEEITIPITIWNNATQQDYFSLSLETTGGLSWDVVFSETSEFVMYAGTKLDVHVVLTAPVNAQAGDAGPLLKIDAHSSLSDTNITSNNLDLVRVGSIDDLVLRETPIGSGTAIPNEATAFSFEVENNGNGPTTATISVSGLRGGWDYWIDSEIEHNISEIYLSPSYEGNDVKNFTLWVVAPDYEDAGEPFSMVVSVSGTDANNELSPEDNTVEIIGSIAEIRKPIFSKPILDNINSSAGSSYEIEIHVKNIGNSYDIGNKVKMELIGSDSYGIIFDLIRSDDSSRRVSMSEWLSLPIGADEEISLILKIEIPSTVSLNSIVELNLILQSGFGLDGQYITVNHQLTIDINQFRYVIAQTSLQSGTISENTKEEFYINTSSNSNINEVLTIQPNIPEGWEMSCSDVAQDGEFVQVLPPAVGGVPRSSSNKCTILANGPFLSGNVSIRIIDADGNTILDHTSQIAIENTEVIGADIFGVSYEDIGTKEIVVLIVTVFLTVVLILLIITIRNKRYEEYDEEEDADDNHTNTTTTPIHYQSPQVAQQVVQQQPQQVYQQVQQQPQHAYQQDHQQHHLA